MARAAPATRRPAGRACDGPPAHDDAPHGGSGAHETLHPFLTSVKMWRSFSKSDALSYNILVALNTAFTRAPVGLDIEGGARSRPTALFSGLPHWPS